METSVIDHQTSEQRWDEWIEKGDRREKVNARRFRFAAITVAGLLAVVSAWLLIGGR